MLTVKKQFTAFALLLLVALPVFLSVGIFIKQQLVQQQRTQRFKTELLETFTIKAEKVDWVEVGKEIRVDGKLFDVESFKVSGANIIFTGFFDGKEDKLVQQIVKLEKQKKIKISLSTGPMDFQIDFFVFPALLFAAPTCLLCHQKNP